MGLRPQHPQSERPLTAMTDDDLPIKPATRLVQAGRRAEWTKGVVNVPVWRGSTVLYDNVAHMRATGAGDLHEKLFYGRKGLPTQWSLADALTSLEPGAQATFLYPSGVAAIGTSKAATFAVVARPSGRSRSSGFHGRSWGGAKAFSKAKPAQTSSASSHTRFHMSARSRFIRPLAGRTGPAP